MAVFNWHEKVGTFYTPPLTWVRYADLSGLGEIEIAFSKNIVWIFTLRKEKPQVILIKSKILTQGLKNYFDFLWDKAVEVKWKRK